MLSLGGLVPLAKVPQLHNSIDQLETMNSENSDQERDIHDLRQHLRDAVDWEMMSDGNVFDESYGEESDYYDEGASGNGDLAHLMDEGDNKDDSSFNSDKNEDLISKLKRQTM